MSKEECGGCKFWRQIDLSDEGIDDSFGNCRRHPPVRNVQDVYDKALDKDFKENTADKGFSVLNEVARWSQPLTYGIDWCGEFKLRLWTEQGIENEM